MKNKLVVNKSKLEGKVTIDGAKNSSLKLLTASLLTEDEIVLKQMPTSISDLEIHLGMLEILGKNVNVQKDKVIISNKKNCSDLNWNRRSIRNTILILGALLTKYGHGKVPYPGGCKLGERKFDLHLNAMKEFGAKIEKDGEYLYASVQNRLKGTEIFLPIRSTGATENCIIMGSLAQGKTKIWNPHIRPEIIDLIKMLNKMGAKIIVNGQESIEIEGVEFLKGAHYTCIPDNMEALTYTIGAAITGGEVEINNYPLEHLEIPLIYLKESGLKYYISEDKKNVIIKNSELFPFEVATGPYPSLNSDMQPIFAVWGMLSKGKSKIIDLRFPGRYQYMSEFIKMGANLQTDGNVLEIIGGGDLKGTDVTALDLRAGAAILLAGLCAEGETIINNFEQIKRGYSNIISKMNNLGANLKLID